MQALAAPVQPRRGRPPGVKNRPKILSNGEQQQQQQQQQQQSYKRRGRPKGSTGTTRMHVARVAASAAAEALAQRRSEYDFDGDEFSGNAHMAENNSDVSALVSPVLSLGDAWAQAKNEQGQTYFWNTRTRETAWHLPPGALLEEELIAAQTTAAVVSAAAAAAAQKVVTGSGRPAVASRKPKTESSSAAATVKDEKSGEAKIPKPRGRPRTVFTAESNVAAKRNRVSVVEELQALDNVRLCIDQVSALANRHMAATHTNDDQPFDRSFCESDYIAADVWELRPPRVFSPLVAVDAAARTWLTVEPNVEMDRDTFLSLFYERLRPDVHIPEAELEVLVLKIAEAEIRRRLRSEPTSVGQFDPAFWAPGGQNAHGPGPHILKPRRVSDIVLWPCVTLRVIDDSTWHSALVDYAKAPTYEAADRISRARALPLAGFALASLCTSTLGTPLDAVLAGKEEFLINHAGYVRAAKTVSNLVDVCAPIDNAPWLERGRHVRLPDGRPRGASTQLTKTSETSVYRYELGPSDCPVSVQCTVAWLAWDFLLVEQEVGSSLYCLVVDLPGLDPAAGDFFVETDDVSRLVLHGEFPDHASTEFDSLLKCKPVTGAFQLELTLPRNANLGGGSQLFSNGVLTMTFPMIRSAPAAPPPDYASVSAITSIDAPPSYQSTVAAASTSRTTNPVTADSDMLDSAQPER